MFSIMEHSLLFFQIVRWGSLGGDLAANRMGCLGWLLFLLFSIAGVSGQESDTGWGGGTCC